MHWAAECSWFSFGTISGRKVNLTRLNELKRVMSAGSEMPKIFLHFFNQNESFIQVRLTVNTCGFLPLIPSGNKFGWFFFSLLASAILPLACLATHPELLILGWLRAAE